MAVPDPLVVLVYVMILCVGPCRSLGQSFSPACHLEIVKTFEEYEYIQEGDIMIGGVMTAHLSLVTDNFPWNKKGRLKCIDPSQQNFRHFLDFKFAVEQSNKDPALLPNLTLGYHIYDSCGDARKAVRSVLQILSGIREPVPNYSCVRKRNIAGFIGDLGTDTTIPIAHTLHIYGFSQISYGDTDHLLADRGTFPYLFQTVQNEESSYIGLGKLLRHFGWTWVGIITSDDIRGEKEHQHLIKYLYREGICTDFTIKINIEKHTKTDINNNIDIIQKSSTSIMLLCGTVAYFVIARLILIKDATQEKTLILFSNWGTNDVAVRFDLKIFNCSLLFVPSLHYNLNTAELERFLDDLHPSKYPEDRLLENIWMIFHFCLSKNPIKNLLYQYIYWEVLHNCTGQERITDLTHFTADSSYSQVYLAVEMMSHAIHDMNVQFSGNIVKIIEMYHYEHQIPKAQCSDNCLRGFRKAPKPRAQSCCYDCVPCSEGEISNETDSISCFKCPAMEWPNERKNQCIARKEDFLSYTNNVISIFVSSIAVFFFHITLLIFGIFISYRNTPIVRANNRSLSFLLLVSIKLSFLSVFLFLGRPVDITCMLRNITFGITFSIAVSSLMAKTIMVCVAFKATKPGSSWRKWVGVKLSNSVVLFCSSIQIIICMTWLSISPPFQELDLHTYPGTIIIQCNEGSAIGFYSVIGYMGLLAAVSFVLAFVARTLPDSFNEAKYITFSMLLFCSVWITMIPAYLSTKGKNTVCVEIFAILTSSAGLLFCIFLPKCYIILFRPEINTKSHLLGNKK
ncbi:hypothetical protein XELAEV_18008725mg [Xenopus laevis]|uniref:G-protein coupled receptors family 3 profile domain-containing protein n=1 Tax=Xenopus laevis TaxID=8355 RepID=A0A974DSR6_XENLA|nr:hypothetical protein XELAEV_18008725mg [Xenopus laevis]